MRIYLDSNVFRDLKKSESKPLYELILSDKERNYYCFSEAHIEDLVQDSTDKKIMDMDFMETIVNDNCWYYNKAMKVRFLTPRTYYGDYHWGGGTDIMTADDSISVLIKDSFRAVPLEWKSLINPEQLPADFPEDLRTLLLESATILDFMEAMLDLTGNLSAEQPRFKRLLQYLYRSLGEHAIYEKLGIKGFDGKNFTDWDAFAESFKELVYQRSNEKDLYNQFLEIRYALDIYSIVKGKPKKQKFMSLLNDGKHAYYAGHAHILVTSDTDMIAKTKLLYKIWQIETAVMTPQEFKQYLIETWSVDDSVATLFDQFDQAADLPSAYEKYTLEEAFIQKKLPIWYLSQCNMFNCATAWGNT